MGAARRFTPAPWTRPGAPRIASTPSWIGLPRVVPGGAPVPPSVRSHPPTSAAPGDSAASVTSVELRPSARPPAVPASLLPLARMSVPPVPVLDPLDRTRELELEAEVQALREQLGQLVTELATVRARILEDSEPEVVRLALSVAGRVIGHEVTLDPPVVLGWVREGLSALPGRSAPALVVAPDVAEVIPLELLSDEIAGGKVTVDPTLRRGSCELREGATIVPIGAAERLAAISDALGVDKERS